MAERNRFHVLRPERLDQTNNGYCEQHVTDDDDNTIEQYGPSQAVAVHRTSGTGPNGAIL